MPLNYALKNVKVVNFMLHFLFIFLPQLKAKQTPTQPGFHSWFWHLRHNLASLKVSGWEGDSRSPPASGSYVGLKELPKELGHCSSQGVPSQKPVSAAGMPDSLPFLVEIRREMFHCPEQGG